MQKEVDKCGCALVSAIGGSVARWQISVLVLKTCLPLSEKSCLEPAGYPMVKGLLLNKLVA
jgi:hypothetical protein